MEDQTKKRQKDLDIKNKKRYEREHEKQQQKERVEKLRKNGAYFKFSKEIKQKHEQIEDEVRRKWRVQSELDRTNYNTDWLKST